VSDEAREPPPPREPEESSLDRFLEPFFTDSGLWPTVFVAAAIGAVFGAAIVLMALRARNLFALAALALLVVMSGDVLQRDVQRRRLGRASRVVLVLWTLVALTAGGALAVGIF
jgi:hypothetical protein